MVVVVVVVVVAAAAAAAAVVIVVTIRGRYGLQEAFIFYCSCTIRFSVVVVN